MMVGTIKVTSELVPPATAAAGTIITADKTTAFNNLPNATKISARSNSRVQGYASMLEGHLNAQVSRGSCLHVQRGVRTNGRASK